MKHEFIEIVGLVDASCVCPKCGTIFKPRKNKVYCSRKCQVNSARGDRTSEYKKRNAEHYGLAGRLKKVLDTLPEKEYHLLIQTILRTASVGHAKLRNVLLDPLLLKQRQSAALQVKIYCIEYYKTNSEDAILNTDRSYSNKNYINSKLEYTLQRNYPDHVGKEEVKQFEGLLYDLWDMEREVRRKNSEENGDYVPLNSLEDEGKDYRKAAEIVYVEIVGVETLPKMEVNKLTDFSLMDFDSVLDDEDDWNVARFEVKVKSASAGG